MRHALPLLWTCLVACGAPSTLPVESPPAPESPAPWTLSCAAQTECPSSVGMLVSPREDGTERCTGFLVSPNLFLTAGHCLAESAREPGRSCSDHRVYFPSSSEPPTGPASCLRVHSFNHRPDGDILHDDWALLELSVTESRERPHLPSARTRPAPTTTLTLYGVRPIQDSAHRHELMRQSCTVTDGEQARSALGQRADRMGWTEGCYVYPGHSGGPLVDAEGRVRGFAHAGGDPFFAVGVIHPLPVYESSDDGSRASSRPAPKESSRPL